MPKQIYNIRAFHGGINSNSDARDIAENELHEAIDIMVDKIGQTRMMGASSTMSPPAVKGNSIEPGYGLFQFSHDRVDGHTSSAGSSDEETGADYLAFSDPDTHGNVSIYSAEDTTWGDPITGMTNNSGGQRKDVFYFIDGNLRVCDSNFGNSNANKWYGYIDRTHFENLTPGGNADSYDAWYCKDAEIKKPTNSACADTTLTGQCNASATVSSFIGPSNTFPNTARFRDSNNFYIGKFIVITSGDADGQARAIASQPSSSTTAAVSPDFDDDPDTGHFFIYPAAGDGFHVQLGTPTGSSATFPAGTIKFGITYIYDAEPGEPGAQESYIRRAVGNNFTVSAGQGFALRLLATSPYDPRLTGGRLYYQVGATSAQLGEWTHIMDISLKYGARVGLSGSYSPWEYLDSGTPVFLRTPEFTISEPGNVTWEDLNGMPAENEDDSGNSIMLNTAKYKTAVVSNRMVYIGNVNYNGITYGDAVFKSPVNRFDTFSDVRKLEASINDGDSIVKLEAYADRLLIFKKKKLELLNISQELEFIEDTFVHKGVSHPAATCKTDFGIAWANEKGCYLYDGQRVNNLLEKGGRQIIKESDWATFITENSMIGYIPSKRQLLVVKDCTHSSVGDVYLYDIVTKSWVYGNSKCSDSIRFTNFVTDWNGDLIYIETDDTGTSKKWSDASGTSTGLHIQTKDLDFGQPGVRKKIYKVYITYRGDASNVQVNYGSDGGALSGTFFTITSGTDGSTTGGSAAAKCLKNAGTDDWLKAELKPSASINNVSSFQLKLHTDGSNAVASDFEIDSISIVYRTKGIK